MGNPKVKWTSEEEDALKAGVTKHGSGRWKNIIRDPEFAPILINRSNIDLKDKWRNMCIYTAGQGSKDKSIVVRTRPMEIDAFVPSPIQSLPPITSAFENEAIEDSPDVQPEGVNAPKYNDMIFEALSSMGDSNGSDLGAIVGFIEQRHEVQPNFRRTLSSKLRRLVAQGKLEKVQKCYKMKDATSETNISTPQQNDVRSWPVPNSVPRQSDVLSWPVPSSAPKQNDVLSWPVLNSAPKQNDVRSRPVPNMASKQNDVRSWQVPTSGVKVSSGTAEEAARIAADIVADAENKRCLEVAAVRDAEMKLRMVDDAESMLQIIKEIYEHCLQGEIILLA
uniref:MYB transcription factor n=1 Tax=Solanum lycopersicum TaxID=4081 RepID=A0A3Q7FUA4_SOLLC|nr:single myb histone 4 [Solanum lycopersicum]